MEPFSALLEFPGKTAVADPSHRRFITADYQYYPQQNHAASSYLSDMSLTSNNTSWLSC